MTGVAISDEARPHPHHDAVGTELEAVLEAVDAGVVVAAADGCVRLHNAAAERILDGRIIHLQDVLGRFGLRDHADEADPERETVELQLLRLPDRWLEMQRYRHDDDASGGHVGEVVIVRDVTRARQSRGLREAFLGMLSHELRTPVTSIYIASDLLGSRLERLSAAERADLVHDIAEESERMLRLVDDLLVLAHFDEGIELVQVPSLLQRVIPIVVERERRRFPDVEIGLRVATDLPVVTGDETSVQQVVRNLITNAAKYGRGRPVLVDISASEDEPGATVRVLDRGPGVTQAEGEALFRPFFRSARTARASTGAGIGLYVCRRLVEAMGGRMWTRPRAGGGSEFGFWLPEYDDRIHDGFGDDDRRDASRSSPW